MTARILFIVVVQTIALFIIIGMKQWTLSTGTEVLLETRPIDPRSLFRGDYVRLNYSINRLDSSQLDGDNSFKKHDTLYVRLKQAGKYWKPVSLHHQQPSQNSNEVFIKGTVRYTRKKGKSDAVIDIKYGIENYFVPEGEGMALERPKPGEKVDIQVAVDQFGQSGIKLILVGDIVRYREKLY